MPLLPTLQTTFPAATARPSADHEAINIPATDAAAFLQHLRDQHHFDLLADLTAIDNGTDANPRYTVVWHLLDTDTATYIRIASDCLDNDAPAMPTVTQIWPGADWHERETYDLLGIRFPGHPDLRRILMWDGYPHHPLRKDFPLAGLPTELPDAEIAAVTQTPVRPAEMSGGPFVAKHGNTAAESEPTAKDESWNEHREKPTA